MVFQGSILEALGLECVQWPKIWIPDRSQEKLEMNVKVLEKWGMCLEGQKKVVASTPVMVQFMPDEIERKLDWLMGLGMDKQDVVKVTKSHPRLLQRSLENSLMPFVSLFMREGCSRESVKRMIKRHPQVLGRMEKLKSMLAAFQGLLGMGRIDFLNLVVRFPQILGYSMDNVVVPTIEMLLSLQIPKADVVYIIYTAPQVLVRNREMDIMSKLGWLEQELGLDEDAALNVLLFQPRVFAADLSKWVKNREFWRAMGLSGNKISLLLSKTPVLLVRGQQDLQEKFEFARDVLRKGHDEIAECPEYFTHSFVDRILFRIAFLDCRGEDFTRWSLSSLTKSSVESFEHRYGRNEFRDFWGQWEKLDRDTKVKVATADVRLHWHHWNQPVEED